MSDPKIQFEKITNPDASTQEFLWAQLHSFSLSKLNDTQMEETQFFCILAKKEEKIVAAALGYMYFRGLNLQLLWVDSEERGKNLGREMLQKVEEEAVQLNCSLIFGYSFGFQAPKFYLQEGYEQVGVISDFPPGHNCFFLSKKLSISK
ncbi:GNAT family N-acetyltransferase [Leptospira sp. 'Mane']|uniref:GNAT family N-acetyltransferase n=1 Tax=Leptospira sp. 'Mane' TaxID=3387407 RepID=UPI00398B94C2